MARILTDELNQLLHAKLIQHRDNRMTRGTRGLPLPAVKYLDHLVQTAITVGNGQHQPLLTASAAKVRFASLH